ncbi:MAG: hypothetical protein R3B07_11590 [Polyangiaceae bacterium]
MTLTPAQHLAARERTECIISGFEPVYSSGKQQASASDVSHAEPLATELLKSSDESFSCAAPAQASRDRALCEAQRARGHGE